MAMTRSLGNRCDSQDDHELSAKIKEHGRFYDESDVMKVTTEGNGVPRIGASATMAGANHILNRIPAAGAHSFV